MDVPGTIIKNLGNLKALNTRTKGFLLTLGFATLFLFLFYGKLLMAPNSVFFSDSERGEKIYYSAIYHIKYDKDYHKSYFMNYPYGESVIFTDNQFYITNALKFVNKHIFDISNYTVGILNFFLLYSLVFSAIVMYLIFENLRLPHFMNAFFSTAIIFSSPQITYLVDHFSLAYTFVIPTLILLIIKFLQRPSYRFSLPIGVGVFVSSCIHINFAGIACLMVAFMWVFTLKHSSLLHWPKRKKLLHFAIQILIPLLIVWVWFFYKTKITDRPVHLVGFFANRTFLETVFLPVNQKIFGFLNVFSSPDKYSWQSFAFIGFVSLAGIVLMLIDIVKKIVHRNFKNIRHFTDVPFLNILLYISIVGLIVSMGIPFIWGLQKSLQYIPYLRELQEISQFSWIFYYIINIASIYLIIHHIQKVTKYHFKIWIYILVVGVLLFDASVNSLGRQRSLHNKYISYSERGELLRTIKSKKIDSDHFQAIFPLPYFHLGSENFWRLPKCDITRHASMLAAYTGIPNIGSILHRTSIQQTVNSLQMVYEPYIKYNLLLAMKTKNPLLLLVAKCPDKLTNYEQNIYNLTLNKKVLFENDDFALFEITFENFKSLLNRYSKDAINELNYSDLYKINDAYAQTKEQNFVYEDFYGNLSNHAFMGVDAFEGLMNDSNVIFHDQIPLLHPDSTYVVSFWFGNLNQDLYPRTQIIVQSENLGGVMYDNKQYSVNQHIRAIYNNWGLIEFRVKLKAPSDKLKIILINNRLKRKRLFVDELLIRPQHSDIYVKLIDYIGKNNRFYPIE